VVIQKAIISLFLGLRIDYLTKLGLNLELFDKLRVKFLEIH